MAKVITPTSAQHATTPGNGPPTGLQPIRIAPPSNPRQPDAQVFSPVNENGCFEFDRVIKSGEVLKRTRKTKAWKPIHIVLRPNLLSIYKDAQESKLRHQLNLSELTAVARQRDPKNRAEHVFGLFSPSRNFHLAARSDEEAQVWVEAIRREARCEIEDAEMIKTSPRAIPAAAGAPAAVAAATIAMADMSIAGGTSVDAGAGTGTGNNNSHGPSRRDVASSSSEAERRRSSSAAQDRRRRSVPALARQNSHTLLYSGNEQGSVSDFSDTNGGLRDSTLSFSNHRHNNQPASSAAVEGATTSVQAGVGGAEQIYRGTTGPDATTNVSQLSGLGMSPDEERVVCQGRLLLLKSKGGVRQWKKVWVVLRPKSLALYKNEEEYAPLLIVPFTSILNAVEIDSISRSKRFCLQLIAEERNYRFCAPDEDALAKWLGALKSLLARRKEGKMQQTQTEQQSQGAGTGG